MNHFFKETKLVAFFIFFNIFLTLPNFSAAQIQSPTESVMSSQFQKGRMMAVDKISQLKACNLPYDTPMYLKSLILDNLTKLADDVLNSPYAFVADTQPTCAYTLHASKERLYLSIPQCLSISEDLKAIMFLLIHESTHHLGVSDEATADLMAKTILNSDQNLCQNNVIDIYDNAICSGDDLNLASVKSILNIKKDEKPTGNHFYSKQMGTLGIFPRVRECTVISGCGNWQEASLTTDYFLHDTTPKDKFKSAVSFTLIYQSNVEINTDNIGREINRNFDENFKLHFNVTNPTGTNYNNNISIQDYIEIYPISFVTFRINQEPIDHLEFKNMKTTAHCSWGKMSYTKSFENSYKEYEIVLYGKF